MSFGLGLGRGTVHTILGHLRQLKLNLGFNEGISENERLLYF
jgi:hypothetical protein